MRALRRLLLALLVLPVLAAVLLPIGRAVARRYLFPARDLHVEAIPDDYRELLTTTHDGAPVRALQLAARGDARTLVHFHTNRETIEGLAGFGRALHASGLGVVLVEYRGYGRSPGRATEPGLLVDAEAVLDALAQQGIGPERIALSGASLGSGVAAEMAKRHRGARLVLVAPYTSIPDVIEAAAPFVPAAWFVDDRFETGAIAARITVPTLIVHGDADEIVPFWMGERLARDIRAAALVRVPGGHHGDLFARDPALVGRIAAYAL